MSATTVDEFFAGREESRRIFDAVRQAAEALGPLEIRVSRSQIALARGTARGETFARVWTPDAYLGGGHAPLVLTLGFRHRDPSTRWKEVVEPAPGRFTHHLELNAAEDVDDEVVGWLREASEGR